MWYKINTTGHRCHYYFADNRTRHSRVFYNPLEQERHALFLGTFISNMKQIEGTVAIENHIEGIMCYSPRIGDETRTGKNRLQCGSTTTRDRSE